MIYFDNAATTPCSMEVMEAISFVSTTCFANPSAMYPFGMEAENLIKGSKLNIASIINAMPEEIFITSGGTESINTAIYGATDYKKNKHFVSSCMEHSAAHNCLLEVEKMGNTVSFVGTDKRGKLSIEELKTAITKDTVLFNLIYVNNEIGVIQDVEDIIKVVKSINPKCYVHLDATQALGKIKIDVVKLGIDLMSASAHKINGPKGVGLLYKKKSCNIKPLIVGGGQQACFRSGTENVSGALALSVAMAKAYEEHEDNAEKLREIKERFISGVEKIDAITINSPIADDYSSHIVSISVQDVRSEVLLNALAEHGICISAGSACHTHSKNTGSRTLKAIALPLDLQKSTVRFSFGKDNTLEEVDYALDKLKSAVLDLRKYVRR